MLAKLKALKKYRKAIIAGLGAAAGVAYARVAGGFTQEEWLEMALAAVSVGIATWAVRNGDKPKQLPKDKPKQLPKQVTFDRTGGYR